MYIKRHIDNYLLDWKNAANRKPLLLRGARQVGKTTAVKHLGEHVSEVSGFGEVEKLEIHGVVEVAENVDVVEAYLHRGDVAQGVFGVGSFHEGVSELRFYL